MARAKPILLGVAILLAHQPGAHAGLTPQADPPLPTPAAADPLGSQRLHFTLSTPGTPGSAVSPNTRANSGVPAPAALTSDQIHGGWTFAAETADPSLLQRRSSPTPTADPAGQDALMYRTGGQFTLSDALAFDFGKSGFDRGRTPIGRAAVAPGQLAPPGDPRANGLDLYDASLRWNAFRLNPLTLSVLSGVRAVSYLARFDDPTAQRERAGMAMTPVVGVGARFNLRENLALSGGGAWRLGEDRGDKYFGLSAELAIDLTRALGLSVGYERMHAELADGVLGAQLNRDLVFARLRLRF